MSPRGITSSLRERVRRAAVDRCGYCLSRRELVLGVLEIEHLVPLAVGGTNAEENLWLSCSLCNRHKATQLEAVDPLTNTTCLLFNPRQDKWQDHFRWSVDGTVIIGQTPKGRATEQVLQLNNDIAVELRRNWVLAGWHPD